MMKQKSILRSSENVDLEPNSKRMKEEAVEDVGDPLSWFPPEILLQIFLKLRNEDLFLGCSLVSKSWRDFLNSNFFFESLIVREFGPERAKLFFQKEGALQRLKEGLARFSIFCFDFVEKHVVGTKQEVLLNSSTATFNDFITATRSERPDFFQENGKCEAVRSTGQLQGKWILKLPSQIFEAMDLLKIPIVDRYQPQYSSFSPPQGKVALLDAKLKPLASNRKEYGDLVVIRDYPEGVRYFYGGGYPKMLRICLPSLCEILKLSDELKNSIFHHSIPNIERILDSDPGLAYYGRIRSSRFEQSPLTKAIHYERTDILKPFIDRGAFVKSALFHAIHEHDLPPVKLFLERGLFDVNLKMKNGEPLLQYAVNCRAKKIADLLVAKGADVDYADEDGTTLLMQAVEAYQLETVYTLINLGADVNRLNKKNQSPLQFALNANSKFPIVPRLEALVSNGAKVNAKFTLDDGSESTALIEAVRKQKLDAVKLLLENGAKVNAKDSKGLTAIDCAKNGDKKSEKLLELLREA